MINMAARSKGGLTNTTLVYPSYIHTCASYPGVQCAVLPPVQYARELDSVTPCDAQRSATCLWDRVCVRRVTLTPSRTSSEPPRCRITLTRSARGTCFALQFSKQGSRQTM